MDMSGVSVGKSYVSSPELAYSPYVTEMLKAVEMPGPSKALCIGLGPGLIPTALWYLHGISSDILEPSREVLELAKKEFGYVPHGTVYLKSGEHLEKIKGSYDYIFLDAYNGFDIAESLYSKSYFRVCSKRLAKAGVFVQNFVTNSTDACFRNEQKLYKSFENVRSTSNREAVKEGELYNAVFFADNKI